MKSKNNSPVFFLLSICLIDPYFLRTAITEEHTEKRERERKKNNQAVVHKQ